MRHFLFPFSWGSKMTTLTSNFTWRSSNRHIVNLLSSTTVEIRTPYCEDDSTDDGRTAPKRYPCSLVSLTTRRRSSAFSKHVFRSEIIRADDSLSTADHVTRELLVMLSEIAAASDSISIPVSEKKLHCVKTGSLTKSWTHCNTLRTMSSRMATRSKFTVNFSPETNGPRRARAVN